MRLGSEVGELHSLRYHHSVSNAHPAMRAERRTAHIVAMSRLPVTHSGIQPSGWMTSVMRGAPVKSAVGSFRPSFALNW